MPFKLSTAACLLLNSVINRLISASDPLEPAAIFGELDHHLFVQPYIHFCRVLHISLIVEFLSQTLAGRTAAVQIEKLHQVDDRGSPP